MRLTCALCGRPMDHPAVQIGEYPVGPVCAKRAGLMQLAHLKGGIVFPVVTRRPRIQTPQPQLPLELDLLEPQHQEMT